MTTTGKEIVNLSTVSQNLLNPNSALCYFFNQSQEARGGVRCSLVGWLCLFQLQMMTMQNSNWKMREITIYFQKAAFA